MQSKGSHKIIKQLIDDIVQGKITELPLLPCKAPCKAHLALSIAQADNMAPT